MADRYQDRPFPADDRGVAHASAGAGGDDPLAELARLIGQGDPRGGMSRANQPVKPRAGSPPAREELPQQPPAGAEGAPGAGPLPWMQRANRPDAPPQDAPNPGHPVQRHAAPPQAGPEPDFRQAPPPHAEQGEQVPDPSRYDDALFGQLAAENQHSDFDQPYADDGYGYQDGYDDDADDHAPKRRVGLVTVAVVLALAVVGTGGAFAYRSFFGSSRSGEPPIIRADTGPTKVMANADGLAKVPDRLSSGDGTEKIVPREEAPVDVDSQSGPRVVLPSMGQGSSGIPPISSAVPASSAPAAGTSGTGALANNEPRRVRTLSVHGDQQDPNAVAQVMPPPAGKPAPIVRSITTQPRAPASATNANASAPLSLVPGSDTPEPRTRVAATTPVQAAPNAGGASGGYLVQVSSQRNEADAQASYKSLQGKFPALGSRPPVIKRADLGEKGVYYRAMVGPFDTPDEATQFCTSLKTAGGQCVVQKN